MSFWDKCTTHEAFIKTSYVMMALSFVGMIINPILYVMHIVNADMLIFVTLVLSYLALIFSAYGNIISAQVNKKVEELDVDSVDAKELKVGRVEKK